MRTMSGESVDAPIREREFFCGSYCKQLSAGLPLAGHKKLCGEGAFDRVRSQLNNDMLLYQASRT
jgi:hypothetical protein